MADVCSRTSRRLGQAQRREKPGGVRGRSVCTAAAAIVSFHSSLLQGWKQDAKPSAGQIRRPACGVVSCVRQRCCARREVREEAANVWHPSAGSDHAGC
jgi:hypothetical protein